MIMPNAKDLFDWSQSYGEVFSEDFKESMANYLINGFMPGGFGESMLAHDMERSLYNCDTHNCRVYVAIARWVRTECPPGAHGSYELVKAWSEDQDGRRTRFAEPLIKAHAWATLKGEHA